MFRPNRIGNPLITDISATDFLLDQSTAENLASLGTLSVPDVQTDTATLNDPVSCVNFNTGAGHVSWAIGGLTSWSFGRFLSGVKPNDADMVYAYAANVVVTISNNQSQFAISLYAGRANASTITVDKTASVNPIDEMACLYTSKSEGAHAIEMLNAQGTFIDSLHNGGASGVFDENPIGLFFSVENWGPSGSVNILAVKGSLSFYRYSQDLKTFDPTR